MNDFKKMSDRELAMHMIDYIKRVENLMNVVGAYLEGASNNNEIYYIRKEYKSLKESIRNDAHYVDLCRNRKYDNESRIYTAFFVPSIFETAAEGFRSHTNSKINHQFFSSIYDAYYKLTKYYNLEEWENIAYS